MTRENKRKTLRKLILLFLILAITLIGFRVVKAFKSNAEALKEDLPPIYTMSSEDSNLIASEYKKNMKVMQVRRSKVRDDISILSINDDHTLIIQRLQLINTIPLLKAVTTEQRSTDRSTMTSYSVIPFEHFSYQYKAGSNEPSSKLYLTLSGKAYKNIKGSDSVMVLYLLADNVSVRYGNESPIDTYIATTERLFKSQPVSLNLMLIQKTNGVYLIVLAAKPGRTLPKENLIEDIIH